MLVSKISIDVLLVDSKMTKMTTFSDISEAYFDVYHVSVMVPFIRWCQSPYLKAWFPFLFSGSTSRNILVTYPWTSSYDRALGQILEQSFSFRADLFLWNSEWRLSIMSCRFSSSMELWESPPWIVSWYFVFGAGVIYHLSESFQCYFRCSKVLLKSQKKLWHCITSFLHWTIPYTSWMRIT
jgi:hypothetical protein